MNEKTKMELKGFLWFLFWTVLIFIGSWLFVRFSSFTGISKDTFLWITSSIAQTFGAILGIFIAVAIFRQSRLEELEFRNSLLPNLKGLQHLYSGNEEKKEEEEQEEEQEEKWTGLWPILYLPTECMIVLIASSLMCLMFTDFFNDAGIAIASIFLIFYSFLCFGLLLFRIPRFFS
jgi:hypothetical protein